MSRLTADEVAAQLHVKEATVRAWARTGALRGFKVGLRWLFDQADVDDFVESGQNRAPAPRRRRRRAA